MFRLLLALIVGLSVLPAGHVSAQDPSSVGEISEARALFIAGRSAFNEGRYEAAYDYFKRSLELSGRKLLLFNMAQCLDRLRRDQEALDTFEAYLQEVPNAENRAEVESRIHILKEAIARQAAAAPPATNEAPLPTDAPAPAASPETASPPSDVEAGITLSSDDGSGAPFPIGPVATMAGGGVVAVVGAALMASALGTKSDIAATQPGERSAQQVLDDRSSAEGLFTAGQVMLYGGVAVAAGGLVWLLLDNNDGSETGVALLPSPTGVSLAGRF